MRRTNKKGKGKKHRKPHNKQLSRTVNGLRSQEYMTFTWTSRRNITQVGSNNACHAFRVSDPQFVDFPQSSTSTNLPFHDSLKNRYRQQRLESADILVSFSNSEIFPICCVISASNFAVSQNDATFDTVILDQPVSQRKFIGPLTGNGITSMKKRLSTAFYAGAPVQNVPDTYTGSTDSTLVRPTNFWYFVVGITSNGTLTSVGVNVDIRIRMRVRGFEVNSSLT